jgi:hypothetical protein
MFAATSVSFTASLHRLLSLMSMSRSDYRSQPVSMTDSTHNVTVSAKVSDEAV